MATSFEPVFASAEDAVQPGWIGSIRASESEFSGGLPLTNGVLGDERDANPCDSTDPLIAARQEGEAAGFAAAQAEFEAKFAELDASFAKIEEAFEQKVSTMLAETVTALCEAALEPLALDKDALLRRCSAAASHMRQELGSTTLTLHPEDRESVAQKLEGFANLEADPTLDRGALRLTTPNSVVLDGPDQWSAAIRRAIKSC